MKNTNELFKLVGTNFKTIRKNKLGLTQEQLAEETFMSRSFISQIESSKVDVGISLDTLFFIAQKYNFDIREFFNGYETLMKKKEK